MKRVISLYIFVALLCGCMKESHLDDGFHQRLVVEGRIEQGREAVVMLSLTTPYADNYDEDTFRDMIIRWAKVTVICDEHSEVLTGRANKDYPTQFIYTGLDIIGEVGKSYTLEVEYSGQKWSATTTIPEPIELTDIKVNCVGDDQYTISATLAKSSTPSSVDCSLDGSSYFAPTLIGTYAPSTVEREITINRPLDNFIRKGYSTVYKADEVVRLRVNTMCDFGYDYWRAWENNVINSLNPVFPATSNLPSNISNGGIGIWAGYGTTYYNLGEIK